MQRNITVYSHKDEDMSGQDKPLYAVKNQPRGAEAVFSGIRAPIRASARGAVNCFLPFCQRIATAPNGVLVPAAV